MNKKAVLFVFVIVILAIIGVAGWRLYTNQNQNIQNIPVISTKTPKPRDFTASFEIYTNGTKRTFTAVMYHNKSPDVFIQNPDPSIIYVKKAGVTWADFFQTLPFSLNKTCLVTGTKQTFCSTQNEKLRFFLNDIEMPDALDLQINPDDNLRVTYAPS